MLEVPFFEDIYRPHCLLRGFETGSSLMTLGKDLSPENLDHLLRLEDYEAFNLGLENGPHIAIPRSINGDFSLHTAPFGRCLRRTGYEANMIRRSSVLPPSYPTGPTVVALAAIKPGKKICRVLGKSSNEFIIWCVATG